VDTVKFIDLFAGIGGLRMGFESAFNELGIETKCVFTSEIKPHAINVLTKNYEHEILAGDITKVSNEKIPDFDILLAGFPCQAFSSAGKRLGFLDTRGTLFFEVERILRDKKPYGFILENVEGLIKHDLDPLESNVKIGRTLKTILKALHALGYNVSWELLDSKHFGVPQSRKRVFIVGTLDETVPLTNFVEKTVNLKEVLEKNLTVSKSKFTDCLLKKYDIDELYGKSIKDKRGGKNNIHSWDIEIKGEVNTEQRTILSLLLRERRKKHWAEKKGIKWMDGMPLTLEEISSFYHSEELKGSLDDLVKKDYLKYEHPKDLVVVTNSDGREIKQRKPRLDLPKGYNIVTGKLSFEFNKILDPNDFAPTIVATDVSKLGVADGGGIRQLTIREGVRLFGFPDEFEFHSDKKSHVFDLLGNTVVVPVVRAVADRLGEQYLYYHNNVNNCRDLDVQDYSEALVV